MSLVFRSTVSDDMVLRPGFRSQPREQRYKSNYVWERVQKMINLHGDGRAITVREAFGATFDYQTPSNYMGQRLYEIGDLKYDMEAGLIADDRSAENKHLYPLRYKGYSSHERSAH